MKKSPKPKGRLSITGVQQEEVCLSSRRKHFNKFAQDGAYSAPKMASFGKISKQTSSGDILSDFSHYNDSEQSTNDEELCQVVSVESQVPHNTPNTSKKVQILTNDQYMDFTLADRVQANVGKYKEEIMLNGRLSLMNEYQDMVREMNTFLEVGN